MLSSLRLTRPSSFIVKQSELAQSYLVTWSELKRVAMWMGAQPSHLEFMLMPTVSCIHLIMFIKSYLAQKFTNANARPLRDCLSKEPLEV